MPRKEIKLSWFKPARQWRKFRTCRITGKGKMHYLDPKGINKSDAQAKELAWQNWLVKLASIEQAERRHFQTAHVRQSQAATGTKPVVIGAACNMLTDYMALGFSPPAAASLATPETTLAELLKAYLAKKRLESECGERSIQTYREHLDKLNDFDGFIRDMTKITKASEITAVELERYKLTQKHLMSTGKISAATVRKRLLCLKQFLEYCFEIEAITVLPRNVNRKFARVEMPEANPKRFTVDELQKLWKQAPSQPFGGSPHRLRLCIALALNCGYNPTCIASLEHDCIDWEKGVIDRPRHKTSGRQIHKLWPITLELLKAEASEPDSSKPGGGLVLVGSKGRQLVHERIKDDGKTTRSDTIGRNFTRIKEALGMTGDSRGFKVLRATAANDIEQKFLPHVSSLFLAHTEKKTKRHYVEANYTPLWEALEYLESLYGLKV